MSDVFGGNEQRKLAKKKPLKVEVLERTVF